MKDCKNINSQIVFAVQISNCLYVKCTPYSKIWIFETLKIWKFENLKIWKFKFEFWKIWICTWSLICYFYIYVFFFLGSCPVRVIKNRTLYVLRWNKMLKHCHAIWLRFGTNLHALSYLEWFENNNGEVWVRDYAFRVINLNRKMI